MKDSSKVIYERALRKIGVNGPDDLNNSTKVLSSINDLTSDSYKLIALRAIYNIATDQQYSKYKPLYNQLQNKKKIVESKNPMTLQELFDIKVIEKDPIKQLANSMIIYMNTRYPLRLDYYNLPINPNVEKPTNYLTYKNKILTLYLNDYKNVRSLGPQIITYNDPFIVEYLAKLTAYFGHMPEYLLYRYDKDKHDLRIFGSRIAYGRYLQDILTKYSGVKMTINDIRKIHESTTIQNSKYSGMTNEQKKEKHAKLLHSKDTALKSYNKSF
jgi:hypothetical protein